MQCADCRGLGHMWIRQNFISEFAQLFWNSHRHDSQMVFFFCGKDRSCLVQASKGDYARQSKIIGSDSKDWLHFVKILFPMDTYHPSTCVKHHTSASADSRRNVQPGATDVVADIMQRLLQQLVDNDHNEALQETFSKPNDAAVWLKTIATALEGLTLHLSCSSQKTRCSVIRVPEKLDRRMGRFGPIIFNENLDLIFLILAWHLYVRRGLKFVVHKKITKCRSFAV